MGVYSPDGSINPGTEFDVTLLQNNDEQIQFSIANGPVPFVLTGYTLTFYLKSSPAESDGAAFSNVPVITSAVLGQFTVNIPHSSLTAPTPASAPLFYHVDATLAGTITTLVFGSIAVIAI
jgi:hypothetical protein